MSQSDARYFDNVPHIAIYGMQDEKKQKSRMLFWRNGVGFSIDISHDDIRNTPFAKEWLEYIREPSSFDPAIETQEIFRRANCLSDCVLSQCLPMLRELAPSPNRWTTLDTYLHTPTYKLKMATDPATKDAAPEIISGPQDKPSYDHWPTAAANISSLPANAPRLDAKDLIVLDQAKNWRCPPSKLRSPDGHIYAFKSCEKTAMYMPDNILTNASIDAINVHSRLFNHLPRDSDLHIPRLAAIVTTNPSPDIHDSSPDTDYADRPRSQHSLQQRTDTILIAGVLLTPHLGDAPTLDDVLHAEAEAEAVGETKTKTEKTKPTDAQREKWKAQITDAVAFLHGQNITIGGRRGENAWCYVNRYTVRVVGYTAEGEDGDAWLSMEAGGMFHDVDGMEGWEARAKFEEERALDLEGVEGVFDF